MRRTTEQCENHMSSMTEDQAAELVARLGSAGVHIQLGLTAAELDEVEARFGFEFCYDHRAFLHAGLPVNRASGDSNPRWPDWQP